LTDTINLLDQKVLVTGGAGFLGSHLIENLLNARSVPRTNIIVPRSKEHDLRSFDACKEVVQGVDIVFHLAARVGGIGFNQKYPAELFRDNMLMGLNLIEAARLASVKKFVQIGTVCAYPKYAHIPFRENELWEGYPEETNAPYGIAKKALLVMAQAYRSEYGMHIIYLLPVNLYGPRDNFDLNSSHVMPALIRKFAEATSSGKDQVTLWGTGNASREFLYVKDAAEGILLAAERYDSSDPVNLGTGHEIEISRLAETIAKEIGFNGMIRWDPTKPDGQPKRSLDTSRAYEKFGFRASTDLITGLKETIQWYRTTFRTA